jgi:hypothetical protein
MPASVGQTETGSHLSDSTVVNEKSAYEDVDHLARSLKNLITVLIELFPEGNDETFDEDAYLTILEKAQDDAKALMMLVENMNH